MEDLLNLRALTSILLANLFYMKQTKLVSHKVQGPTILEWWTQWMNVFSAVIMITSLPNMCFLLDKSWCDEHVSRLMRSASENTAPCYSVDKMPNSGWFDETSQTGTEINKLLLEGCALQD